jgi:acyl carrier protein
MTREEIQAVVIDAITKVAPEADPASIQPGVGLREQLDLDSVDFLNFVVALHERLGVDVPEADYGQLMTLESAGQYLQSKLDQPPPR